MPATIIDGKACAAKVREGVARHVAMMKEAHGITPGLAVVLVGEDPASAVYVNSKSKLSREAGLNSFKHVLPANTDKATLLELIEQLNRDDRVHGILCQLPLPAHLNEHMVINAIHPDKDVDGFHISNVGRMGVGQPAMVPCTPLGCLMLLRDYHGDLSGLNVAVIGRSNIVGKPMANLLLKDSVTVTIVHSRTKNPVKICREADVLVAAVGKPAMVTSEWVKPGATVIDVGINRLPPSEPGGKGRIVGDVDFDSVSEVAGAITPVPGGVGPMTIACLLANTLSACCRAHGLEAPEKLTA